MHERALYIFLVFLSRLFFFIFSTKIFVSKSYFDVVRYWSHSAMQSMLETKWKREKKNETFTRTFDTRRQRLRLTENGLEAARGQ